MIHSFNKTVAKKYSVKEAIIIEMFKKVIAKSKTENLNFYDGQTWIYASVKTLTRIFPYWSASQIYRVIQKLETKGVLKSGKYSTSSFDTTKWYTIVETS